MFQMDNYKKCLTFRSSKLQFKEGMKVFQRNIQSESRTEDNFLGMYGSDSSFLETCRFSKADFGTIFEEKNRCLLVLVSPEGMNKEMKLIFDSALWVK